MSTQLDRIRFSEANTLASCERKWYFGYKENLPYEASPAMNLGTVMHRLCEHWWETGTWEGYYEDLTGSDSIDLDEDRWDTAHWLMERYARHYEPMWPKVRVRKHEVELEAEYRGITVVGHLDGLYEWEGQLWLVERKTMSNFEPKMSQLWVDPQLSWYFWLARENGLDPYGIWYDAIKTYRWKTGNHLTGDSFEQAFVDRTDYQIEVALHQLDSIISRRKLLRLDIEFPIHNIGPLCSGCSYKQQCFDKLGYPGLELVA